MLNKLIIKSGNTLMILTGVLCGIIIGIGTQYVTAWTAPPSPAPGGSVTAPVTTGGVAQSKAGSLSVGTAAAPVTTLDVNGFIRAGNGSQSAIYLEDNQSLNGYKILNANGDSVGFLGGDHKWLNYIRGDGSLWQKGGATFGGKVTSANMGAGDTGNTLATKAYVDSKGFTSCRQISAPMSAVACGAAGTATCAAVK